VQICLGLGSDISPAAAHDVAMFLFPIDPALLGYFTPGFSTLNDVVNTGMVQFAQGTDFRQIETYAVFKLIVEQSIFGYGLKWKSWVGQV
jgi:hypothetical protein